MSTRRGFLKTAGAAGAIGTLPLFGCDPRGGFAGGFAGETLAANGRASQPGIYERLLGVRPVINAAGPLTRIGASLMPAEVTEAMAEASHHYVDLNVLGEAAGTRIAGIMQAEAAMVTSGAFGGMLLGAAACLAGNDDARMATLPHVTWPRRECLIQRAHQFVYDHAYTAAGMTLVPVDTAEEMRAAISERTAMIAGIANVEKWDRPDVILPEQLVAIGRDAGVPVLLDAAGEVPPASNLQRYIAMGADLVVISGGKGLRGPSSTGILAGRADLIASARAQASPHTGIGRGMKVDKEEIVGLIVALERFLQLDHDEVLRSQRAQADAIHNRLSDVPGLSIRRHEMQGPGVVLSWDQTGIPLGYRDFGQQMEAGDPPIVVWTFPILAFTGEPTLYTASLQPGEEHIVAERARDVLINAQNG